MRLDTHRIGRVEISRNDVIGGYRQAYVNTLLQASRFKRRFLECWDGSGKFSLFHDPNKEKMVKLLGIHNQFDGETDLLKTNATEGLDDLYLIWTVKPENATEQLKDIVIANIEHDIFDVYGYEITYQGVELPILVGGVSVDDPYAKMVYDLVAKHIATSGAGTYTFVMNDVDEYLRHEIFEAQHMTTYDVHGIRTPFRSVTGIPMLASFGVETVSTEFGFNLAWNDNDGRMNIDPVAFAALEADQFMSFVQSYLDVEYDEEDQPWYMELLSIVLKIIAIVLVVFTVVIGIQAVAAAMAAGSFTAGIAAFNAVLAGAGLTTTAYGAFAGLVIGVLNVAGALMTLPLLGSIQEAPEAVEKPEDIRTKVGIADETYWTWHDSDKPENVIKSVLEQGKP